jgi:hypothetical protein
MGLKPSEIPIGRRVEAALAHKISTASMYFIKQVVREKIRDLVPMTRYFKYEITQTFKSYG